MRLLIIWRRLLQRLSESKKLRGDGWQEKNMRQRLADYVADFLDKKRNNRLFYGGWRWGNALNDALGHKEGLHCTYNHHEQACAMAAEAYARVNNRIAAVCVTTGPGWDKRTYGGAGRLAGFYTDACCFRSGAL